MESGSMPKKCPACGRNMYVCSLRCLTCGTEVQGAYRLDRFAKLQEEQLSFLETFIKCRGNLKDLCSAIGISYPTARNRLDQLIETLDFDEKETASVQRMFILEKIREGSVTPEEGLELLKQI